MGRRSHGWNLEAVQGQGDGGPPFCAWLLEHIMVVLLQLPAELLEGLKPLTEPQASVWGEAMPQEDSPQADPAPFLETLPSSPNAREELMHGLLLLVATGTSGSGEAPKYAGYDARSRQLLQDAARALGVPWHRMAMREAELARSMRLRLEAVQQTAAAEAAAKRSSKLRTWKRRAAGGAAALASGTLVAVTAGLAAPAVLAGVAALGSGMASIGLVTAGGILTASTVLLAGSAGVVVVTTLFGAGGAGLAAYKMDRRLGAVTEFRFLQPSTSMPPPPVPSTPPTTAAIRHRSPMQSDGYTYSPPAMAVGMDSMDTDTDAPASPEGGSWVAAAGARKVAAAAAARFRLPPSMPTTTSEQTQTADGAAEAGVPPLSGAADGSTAADLMGAGVETAPPTSPASLALREAGVDVSIARGDDGLLVTLTLTPNP